MSSVDGAQFVLATSDETFTDICGPCYYSGTEKEAIQFCDSCQDLLCRSCSATHKGHKSFRNHNLVPVEQRRSKTAAKKSESCIILCDCNQNMFVAVYCNDHDDVVCQGCKTIKHRKCKTVSISDKSASFAVNEFSSIASKAKKMMDEIRKLLNERNRDLQTLAETKEKGKTEVKAFRKELDTYLDLLEKDMFQEIETIEALAKQEIERHLSTLSTSKQMLETDDKLIQDANKTSKKSDMLAADVKVSKRFHDYETVLEDIRQEINLPVITFERNRELLTMKTRVTRLGSVDTDFKQSLKPQREYGNRQNKKPARTLFPNMKVLSATQLFTNLPGDKVCSNISGCAFMPDGQMVLCDAKNERIKVYEGSLMMKDYLALKGFPWDVSVISSGSVIVTLPERQQLQYICVAPRLKAGRIIKLDMMCWGTEVVGEEIYVSCHRWAGVGEVRQLDMNGNLKRRIGVNQDGSYMFTQPYYLTVSARSGKIFVADGTASTVTCLTSEGHMVYQYKDRDLKGPRGIYVDDEDNIIVCGKESSTVQVVTAAGKKHKTLLTAFDFGIIENPCPVAYRCTNRSLIIGFYGQNELYMFNLG